MVRSVIAVVVAALGLPSHAALLRAGGSHSSLYVASATSSASTLDLDLSTLQLHQRQEHAGQSDAGFHILNATLRGGEVACLNCDEELFKAWLQQLGQAEGGNCSNHSTVHGGQRVSGSKHPNSPGYDKWSKEVASKEVAPSFLAAQSTQLAAGPCESSPAEVVIEHIHGWDLESQKPWLASLWKNRRLVIGYGANPMHQRMSFVEALVSLARKSPQLTPPDCDRKTLTHCDSLLSGHKTASAAELKDSLEEAFGSEFLEEHRYHESHNETEQRTHVQALLKKLKWNYSFYYQKCLADRPAIAQCNKESPSRILGRITCRPEDDELSDDCVYAEVRLCEDCAEAGARFFEYSRFHGPLALFATAKDRHGVMGQCEEFSRAAHAMLASQGYTARYVLDFTDHVWVEVQLPKGEHGKWVHADPSEGVLDNPLMYEKHWGKKLTLIFAFTPQKIEQVTATYTEDYPATVLRRGIEEADLAGAIQEANQRLAYEMPMNTWGYTDHATSKERSLEEVALWSHFEDASN